MRTFSYKNMIIAFSGIAVLLFLYFPLLVIILFSFNAETVNSFPIQKFSLHWYKVMWQDSELLGSVWNSVYIAVISTTVALLIGIPAAYAMHKNQFPGKQIIEKIVLLPITLPGIVTGVAMLSFFPFVGVRISLQAVMIGHITFLCAIVVTQMLARFKRLDPFLEQAAYDLGATPARSFFSVILPNIKTAIIGCVLLCLVLSMDEIPITFFLIAGNNTLPLEIYGMMRRGITPEVNAISTVIFIFSTVAILLSLKLNKEP
jgi:spermidine/putrescine transport system permease protein